jgi:hypothetical protein
MTHLPDVERGVGSFLPRHPIQAGISKHVISRRENDGGTDLGHRLSLYTHPSEEDQHFESRREKRNVDSLPWSD